MAKLVSSKNRNGLFLTPECPSIVGGLGRVSVDIPMALNCHAGMDCRVLQPITQFIERLQSNLSENERFRSTGLELSFKTQGGGTNKFAFYQTYQQETCTWVYGIKNELWARCDHLYFPIDIRFSDAALKDAYGSYFQCQYDVRASGLCVCP